MVQGEYISPTATKIAAINLVIFLFVQVSYLQYNSLRVGDWRASGINVH